MEIKVSVLVYVLNGISYADRCLRSVMGQTLGEIEILVIDGGSTDGTLELAEELARKPQRSWRGKAVQHRAAGGLRGVHRDLRVG